MGTYIDADSVRRTCGIQSSEINDTDINSTITEVEKQVPRYFNTVFTPTERIDIMDGNGTEMIILEKNPVLAVREINIDGTDVTPAYSYVFKESGKLILGNNSETRRFKDNNPLQVRVKYIYGMLDNSSISTETSVASTSGTNVSLTVDSITGFADEDWCEIYGTDGNKEVFQISGTPSGNTIVADQLVHSHQIDSKIVKLEINETFKKIMNVIASISLVARIIGESYDDIVGYTLTEFQVQKGEPYTQWRETANQFIKERDDLMKRINIRPAIL